MFMRYFWFFFLLAACSSMPAPAYRVYRFPSQKAFSGGVSRPYETLGLVRSKVNFQTLDVNHDETELCRNYFNKAVQDLVRIAHGKKADAVIDVRSVVFLEDGSHRAYTTAECADDGFEGQVLAQGIAVRWKTTLEKNP